MTRPIIQTRKDNDNMVYRPINIYDHIITFIFYSILIGIAIVLIRWIIG